MSSCGIFIQCIFIKSLQNDPILFAKIAELIFVLQHEQLGKFQMKPKYHKGFAPRSTLPVANTEMSFLASVSAMITTATLASSPPLNPAHLESVELICKWGLNIIEMYFCHVVL